MPFFFNKIRIMPVLVLVSVMLLSGCNAYRDISVDSCTIESISPSGFKAVDAGFSIRIHNPARELVFSDISGTVYFDGEELGYFSSPSVTVPGKSVSEVHVDVTATLGRSFSLMQLMSMASGMRPEKFTADISMKVKVKGGISKKINLEGVPVESLFRKVSYENI